MGVGGIPTLHLGNGGEDVGSKMMSGTYLKLCQRSVGQLGGLGACALPAQLRAVHLPIILPQTSSHSVLSLGLSELVFKVVHRAGR